MRRVAISPPQPCPFFYLPPFCLNPFVPILFHKPIKTRRISQGDPSKPDALAREMREGLKTNRQCFHANVHANAV